MPVWVLIVWLAIGAAMGFLGRRIVGGQAPGGQLGDLVMGIVGALLAGYGASMALPDSLQGAVGGLLASLVAAAIGALALVWVARQLKRSA